MSCHLCFKELEFHEIAGYNPNLADEDANRTNFCWNNDSGTWKAAPVCDDCYWDQNSETDTDTDTDTDTEEEEVEMYSHICEDCMVNPSTPPITSLQMQNASPSDEQELQSPSSYSSWSQP